MLKRSTGRTIIAAIIVVATAVAFSLYFVRHPEIHHQLGQISINNLVLLIGLYCAFIASLAMINTAALKLCGVVFKNRESLLLTMYSSVINFFGPLQSGPAFRAIYLKRRHSVRLRDYTAASFVYYFFYALLNVLLLLSGFLKWWLVPVILLLMMCCFVLSRRVSRIKTLGNLKWQNWPYTAIACVLQIAIMMAIYTVELKAVGADISLGQVAVYTGAANLALFVALTPGAIGFRESFLLLSQQLHNINNATIISANILDRSVYILFLLSLAAIIFGTHAREYFIKDSA